MTATGHPPRRLRARGLDPIDAGEPYVVISIWWTRGEHVEVVARVHEDCTEGLTRAVRSAVSPR